MEHMSIATTRTASRQPGGLGQPVRGVIGGAALHLAQQPLIPGQVKEAGVPPVCEQQVFPGPLIDAPPGTAAAVLINAQVRHQGRGLLQHRASGGRERVMRGRPGDPGVPGRLRRRDPALADLGAGLLPQPGCQTAPRRHLRQRLGERLPRAPLVQALPAALDPAGPHPVAGPPDIPRPGQHGVMPPGRDRPAVRARRRGRVIRDRPYLQRAVRPGLHIGDLQALHAEQHRRRILEHDARGFLMILKSLVRPKIVKAAGSLITAARRDHAMSPEPGTTSSATTHGNAFTSLKVITQ